MVLQGNVLVFPGPYFEGTLKAGREAGFEYDPLIEHLEKKVTCLFQDLK